MEEQMQINYFSPFTIGGAWSRMKNVNTLNSAFQLVTKRKRKLKRYFWRPRLGQSELKVPKHVGFLSLEIKEALGKLSGWGGE